MRGRHIPDIIREGYIVCVGYSNFLKQLLTELEIPITTISTTVIDKGESYGHTRNICYLNDTKYNINGVYATDATFDSRRNNLSLVLDKNGNKKIRYDILENDIVLKEYDGLSLYQYFLIPYKDYKNVFINERFPLLFRKIEENVLKRKSISEEDTLTSIFDDDYQELQLAIEDIEKLFGTNCNIDNALEIIKTSQRPSLQIFKEALIRVRMAEGYSDEEANISVEEVIDLNKIIGREIEKENTIFKEEASTHKKIEKVQKKL